MLDDTPISDGIRYARNQRVGLARLLEDGRLPFTTTGASSSCVGKLSVARTGCSSGHDDAGAVNATFTSLLASCRLCNIEPWAYLRDVLCLLPAWPEHRLLELSPVNWTATRDRNDVRSLLDRNPLRRLTLVPDP